MQSPVQCRAPGDCRVFDWLLASDVPHWDFRERRHFLVPAPDNLAAFWVFVRGSLASAMESADAKLVWLRES
ncbi:hypothetical protein [Haloferula sp. BvORR071]|uniref:hypothetical protein n=1 Tax=Haloferula sp. BvORR071 TaxID=1396141 RepID=UPI0005522168|nr:hypothetical protein [Haloferula sp. BvORR071]